VIVIIVDLRKKNSGSKVGCFREAEIQAGMDANTIRRVPLMKSHWDLIDHHKNGIARAQVGQHQATFGVSLHNFEKLAIYHALKANGD
jgi:hypothetical protein